MGIVSSQNPIYNEAFGLGTVLDIFTTLVFEELFRLGMLWIFVYLIFKFTENRKSSIIDRAFAAVRLFGAYHFPSTYNIVIATLLLACNAYL